MKYGLVMSESFLWLRRVWLRQIGGPRETRRVFIGFIFMAAFVSVGVLSGKRGFGLSRIRPAVEGKRWTGGAQRRMTTTSAMKDNKVRGREEAVRGNGRRP